jgi:MFS transporter, DHA2 family, multidrug resistance protein
VQSSGLTASQSLERMNRVIDVQASTLSANDIFFASALLFLLLIGVVWLARPVKGGAGAGATAVGD